MLLGSMNGLGAVVTWTQGLRGAHVGGIGASVQDKAQLCFGTTPSEIPCLTKCCGVPGLLQLLLI